eukprot:4004810-Heterocapsa_arctica.AAC.1
MLGWISDYSKQLLVFPLIIFCLTYSTGIVLTGLPGHRRTELRTVERHAAVWLKCKVKKWLARGWPGCSAMQ